MWSASTSRHSSGLSGSDSDHAGRPGKLEKFASILRAIWRGIIDLDDYRKHIAVHGEWDLLLEINVLRHWCQQHNRPAYVVIQTGKTADIEFSWEPAPPIHAVKQATGYTCHNNTLRNMPVDRVETVIEQLDELLTSPKWMVSCGNASFTAS